MKLKFSKSTKIRIIVDKIGIFTTVGKYASTFMNGSIINATLLALLELQEFRKDNPDSCGIVGRYVGVDIQVDLI